MAQLPQLPKIEGDVEILLDIYTHRSLRSSRDEMNAEYGDTDRLAELGEHILDLAVTFQLYSKKPLLHATSIVVSIV